MKNVVTFCISGLYMLCKQMKPFNPIIGETYQGYWPDGSSIYCEHTSHHPPITNFFVKCVLKISILMENLIGGRLSKEIRISRLL